MTIVRFQLSSYKSSYVPLANCGEANNEDRKHYRSPKQSSQEAWATHEFPNDTALDYGTMGARQTAVA